MDRQEQTGARHVDSALASLVAAARIFGIPADMEQLKRAYAVPPSGMDSLTLVRAAKDLGLKAKWRAEAPTEELFQAIPLPAIFVLSGGRYIVAMRSEGEQVVLLDVVERPQPFAIALPLFLSKWSGGVVLLAKRASLPEELKKFGITWFIPVIAKYKKFMCQVLFVSLLLQLFGLATPLFTQVIIDKVLVHRSAATLDVLLAGMVFAGIFQALLTMLRSYLFTHTTSKINVSLSSQLFKHITALPLSFFERWQVGDVVSRVRELDTIRQFITGSALTLVLDVVFAVVYLAVMLWYSGILSVITLATVLAYAILNFTITPVFRQRINQRFLAGAENQTFLIEAVTGIQTLKTMAVERQFIDKYEGLLARFAKANFSTAFLGIIASQLGTLLQFLFTAAVLWVGARIVMDGQLSVGELIAFQMLAGQVIAPILRLVNMWQQFQQTMVSVDRLGDIMNEKAEPAFNPNRTTLPAIAGEVVFDKVTFRYRKDGSEVLRQVSFAIRPGMRIGIVGRSGSGKSTITKLMQRLYIPEAGRVLIDGVDLVQVEPAWLRRQIGVVLQENFLFNGTIAENIAIAKPEASQEEIMQAATLAGADEFISSFPKGYDTMVGERGALLSGGQRQRIAIARALLTNPRILIFDEATSALDYESERIIMNHLGHIAHGRTTIMIAHRLSTIKHADIILVVEQGQIVESGTHEALLQGNGFYSRLYQQQEAEFVRTSSASGKALTVNNAMA